MPPILVALISALIPFLVNEAEKLISRGSPQAGAVKHQWVVDAVNTFISALDAKIPDWAKPDEEALAKLIEDAIEAALAKM